MTTTESVTDAQVFEAMGWTYLGAASGLRMRPPDGTASYSIHGLPPVMSNPSSPEAWAAVPVMLEWLRGRVHVGIETGVDGFFWVEAVRVGDMTSYIHDPVEWASEIPSWLGRALVEAKQG